jgi:hypothetical protein
LTLKIHPLDLHPTSTKVLLYRCTVPSRALMTVKRYDAKSPTIETDQTMQTPSTRRTTPSPRLTSRPSPLLCISSDRCKAWEIPNLLKALTISLSTASHFPSDRLDLVQHPACYTPSTCLAYSQRRRMSVIALGRASLIRARISPSQVRLPRSR